MRIETRLRQLEAHREQTIAAEVRRLEHTPTVERYLDTVPLDEVRLLALGDERALQRFGLACGYEVR